MIATAIVPLHPFGRRLAAVCLVLTFLAAGWVGAPSGAAAATSWPRVAYKGARVAKIAGAPATRIAGYSLDYPPGWAPQQWPDTLAGYGQVSLWSPSVGTIDLVLLPLRPHGPTLADLIAQDSAFLTQESRDQVKLPLGQAVRVSGIPSGSGLASQFIYLHYHGVVYRFFSAFPVGTGSDVLLQVAASLHVPAVSGPAGGTPSQSSSGSCCHCPVWGTGWGNVLTLLDGIPVYSNAGNINNGCDGTYGILYQCVELVQRYFAKRWGYSAVWGGVEAASDMRAHHPAGIVFVPNGGSPGPREGDALLFYGGSFGHVALVQSVDRHTGQIIVVEENWSSTGEARLPIYADNTIAIRDSAYGSYTVAGWLHSPKNMAPLS